jgi:nitrate reductase NapE component
MLAELAAANAAFSVIKQAISNGRELSSYASKIGEITNAKEDLQRKVNKKRAAHQSTDFEEFMALERIKEQEDELKQWMIYAGRPGLWGDWVKFQKDARVARREAEIAAEKKRKETIELIIVILAITVLAATIIGFFYWILWLKGIVKWP